MELTVFFKNGEYKSSPTLSQGTDLEMIIDLLFATIEAGDIDIIVVEQTTSKIVFKSIDGKIKRYARLEIEQFHEAFLNELMKGKFYARKFNNFVDDFLEDFDFDEAINLALYNTAAIFFMEYYGLKTIDDELTVIEQLYPEVEGMNYLVDSIAIDYLDAIYGENCLEPFKTELLKQLGI